MTIRAGGDIGDAVKVQRDAITSDTLHGQLTRSPCHPQLVRSGGCTLGEVQMIVAIVEMMDVLPVGCREGNGGGWGGGQEARLQQLVMQNVILMPQLINLSLH